MGWPAKDLEKEHFSLNELGTKGPVCWSIVGVGCVRDGGRRIVTEIGRFWQQPDWVV